MNSIGAIRFWLPASPIPPPISFADRADSSHSHERLPKVMIDVIKWPMSNC